MIYQEERPLSLKPQELDEFLEAGWYRQGQAVFTTHFVALPEGLFPSPWLRLSLADHNFGKRLRKLMRRNAEVFQIQVRPAKIDGARLDLFARFKKDFKGHYYESLHGALFGEGNEADSIFDTQEIALYRDGKLVAFSLFDVGEETIASIMGIYDPDCSQYSLGLYTMLLEIEWGKANGKRYFYPGYAVPGNPRFDYKLRIGEVEFFEVHEQAWQSWDQFHLGSTALAELRRRMEEISAQFARSGLHWFTGFYLNFENPCEMLAKEPAKGFLRYPLFFAESDFMIGNMHHVIEYDLVTKVYRLSLFEVIRKLPFPNQDSKLELFSHRVPYDIADFVFLGTLRRRRILLEVPRAEMMAREVILKLVE